MCREDSKKGKPTWNKGLKGVQVAWNKGINTGQIPWNKGNGEYAKKLGFGKWMIGKKLSEETKKKISEANKGKKGAGWKGGITPKNQIIRTSAKYKDWRLAVFKRDNWTCQECGARSGNGKKVILNADHIKPFYKHIELRFKLTNGRTLCRPCHLKTDTFGTKALKY